MLVGAIALVGLGGPTTLAHEATTSLRVSVVVPPRVTLAVTTPGQLVVTEADLARGHVEVTEPTSVVLESNGPDGVRLDVQSAGELFSGIELTEEGVTTRLPAEGGLLTVRWTTPTSQGTRRLRWKWRFLLRPGIGAGTYVWPLSITALPLETVLTARVAP